MLENNEFFKIQGLTSWLTGFVNMYAHVTDADEPFLRGFLQMLLVVMILRRKQTYSVVVKKYCVRSAEEIRTLSFLTNPQPDLESIQASEQGCNTFSALNSWPHDHTFMQNRYNRVIELTPKGIISWLPDDLDEYLDDERQKVYEKKCMPVKEP